VQGLLIILFVAFIIAVVVFSSMAAAKRRKELGAWAAGRGLTFDSSTHHGMDDQFPEFPCLRQGSSRYAYNVISGTWGERPILAFDYHYVTGSGKHRHTHRFSAVILRSPVPLKPLLIRPESFLDKFAEFVGFDDIDFESAEFSSRFYVKSPDRKWAYDVLHARAMEMLLGSDTFTIQFDWQHAMAYRSGTFKPAEFESATEVVAGLLDLLPEYLVQQQTRA